MGDVKGRTHYMQGLLNTVSADKPISTPPEDRLGYDEFAHHLAQSIRTMPVPEGFVVAVHGKWGSGKTSLINLIEYHLQHEPSNKQSPVIVRINPWWFSSHEDLVRILFSHLLGKLSGKSQEVERLRSKLADFAEAVSAVPIPYAQGAELVAKLMRPNEKDVPALKSEVGDLLRKRGTRYLVVIDDIDRLTPAEVVELLRVVKAVGDLPNVLYLLALDHEIARKALERTYGEHAGDYLEKIVQLPLQLPLTEQRSLRAIFFEKLDLILGAPPAELFDTAYWANMYFEGIDPFLQTPRDIARLTNALTLTYSAVRGEVNVVDFIAVEVLRIFCPTVYNTVRSNQSAFAFYDAGLTSQYDQYGIPSTYSDLYASIFDTLGTRKETVKHLLVTLFPHLNQVWNNGQVFRGNRSVQRRQLRICIPDHFPRYFRLASPEGSLSRTKMEAVLSQAANAKMFAAGLVELAREIRPDGTSAVRTFLEWMQDYTADKIMLTEIPPIIQALLNVGDDLLREEDRTLSLFDFGNEVRIGRVLHQLTQRLEPDIRFNVLMGAVQSGGALATITGQIIVWGQEHGKYGSQADKPEATRTVTAGQLKQLEASVHAKIRQAADDMSLLGHVSMPQILYLWKDLADNEVIAWVKNLVTDIDALIVFVAAFANSTYVQGVGDVLVRRQLRLDPKWLDPFLDAPAIADIAERLRKYVELNKVPSKHVVAVQRFITEWNMRQAGRDPDAPGAFYE